MSEDQVLVQKVLSGDMPAFRLLIKKHERLVVHMIGRLVKRQEEREELCQDVFLRVYDKLGEFSFQSKLSTWVATIAYRYAINHLRSKRILFSEMPDEQIVIEAATPERLMEEEDEQVFVLKLVDLLPPQYKTILTLYHVENMTYPEICEITGMPEGTVKNYLFRARNLLKEMVKKKMGKEELL
jgi:RNA polymerase sigma factor (sigma-70 family)